MKNQSRIGSATIAAVALYLILSLPLFSVWAGSPDNPSSTNPNKQEPLISALDYAPHQLVVRSSQPASTLAYLGRADVRSVTRVMTDAPVYLVQLDPSADVPTVAAQVAATPSVVYAHPNYLLNRAYSIQGSYPFPDQNVTGTMEGQYSNGLLALNEAHAIATGSGVTVGVIDCGVDFAHPKLQGKATSAWDFVDADAVAYDEPDGKVSGHGTFVAGLIHLAAPDANIRSYRVMNQNGYGDGFTVAQAIEQAVNDGCTIINLSLALTARHLAVRDAIDRAASLGVTVIAGSGNDGKDMALYPAAEPNAVSVGSVDSLLRVTAFSNFGTTTDLFAPGQNIYSSYLSSGFAWWSGTSFSAPFVSGVAALLKQQEPAASTLRVRQRMFNRATPIDSSNPAMNGGLGRGMVNPVASLNDTSATDSAVFIPDTLQFTHHIAQLYIRQPSVTGLLLSTKDPAPYIASVIDTGAGVFCWVDDTAGLSGDSVRIYVYPEQFDEGVYYNTIAFSVVGVPEPAYAVVCLTVEGSQPPQGDAWLTPPEVYITAPHSYMTPVYGGSYLSSNNAPALYTVSQRPGAPHVVQIIDTAGLTNDSVRFYFTPSEFFSPGSYDDTLFYSVAGILDPVALAIHITITSDTITGATAWFHGADGDTVFSQSSGTVSMRNLMVGSSNYPAAFTASLAGPAPFITLTSATGNTPGTITYRVDTRGVTPGLYCSRLNVNVAGVPTTLSTNLIVTVTGGGPVDSAWISPTSGQFSAPGGVPTQTQGQFTVSSSGAPKGCIAFLRDQRDFVRLIDSLALTPATMRFAIEPVHTAAGIYVDTIDIYTSGDAFIQLRYIATLHIDTTSDTSSSTTVTVIPSALNVSAPLSTFDTFMRQVLITTSGGPRSYVAGVDGNGSRFVYLPDTTGMTNDSVDVILIPDGRPAGVYTNYVRFYVVGVPGYTTLTVNLTVSESAAAVASVELTNYPNPFNPTTTIAFTLPAAVRAKVEVYDLLGRNVATVFDQIGVAGENLVMWDGTDRYGSPVASGIYFYRLTTENQSLSKKMLLLK